MLALRKSIVHTRSGHSPAARLSSLTRGGTPLRHVLWPAFCIVGLGLALLGSLVAVGAPGRLPAGGGAPGRIAPRAPAQGTPTPTSTPTPPPACGLFWRLVPSPNPGSYNITYAVAAVAANDVWAVDFSYNGSLTQTLIEHWDGSTWTIVSSPNVGSLYNFLQSVAVVSSSDVWAVGDYANGNGTYQTLIEHWNGTTWSVVPSPNQGSASNYLYGVAPVAANDVWAVGDSYNGTIYQTLVEHWNGSAWSIVASPNMGTASNYLYQVKVVAANDIWAVGSAGTQTLIEHWNGSNWSVVPSPNVGTSSNVLRSLTVVAANDVWAVGDYANGGSMQALIAHWNGSAWNVVPGANGPAGDTVLQGVAAVAANDIWAVGYSGLDVALWQTFAEHWDGTTWSLVPVPPGTTSHNAALWGVAVVAANDVWAVGDDSLTVAEHYSDPCSAGTVTPTATRTPGPPTATATGVPPSATPGGPTATAVASNTPPPATATPGLPSTTPAPTQTPGGPSATPGPSQTPRPPSSTATPPAPTRTPGGPSATPGPSHTPAATATPCPLSFSDVHARECYELQVINCTTRLSISIAKAKKCNPTNVSGKRS